MGTKKGLGLSRARLEDTYEANIDENLAFGTNNQKLTPEQKLTQENIQKSRAKALSEKMAEKKKSLADKKASGKAKKKFSKVGFSEPDGDGDGKDTDSRKFSGSPRDTIHESKKTVAQLRGNDGGSESDALKSDKGDDKGMCETDLHGMGEQAINLVKHDFDKGIQGVEDDDSRDDCSRDGESGDGSEMGPGTPID
jgi:hypothetical protein